MIVRIRCARCIDCPYLPVVCGVRPQVRDVHGCRWGRGPCAVALVIVDQIIAILVGTRKGTAVPGQSRTQTHAGTAIRRHGLAEGTRRIQRPERPECGRTAIRICGPAAIERSYVPVVRCLEAQTTQGLTGGRAVVDPVGTGVVIGVVVAELIRCGSSTRSPGQDRTRGLVRSAIGRTGFVECTGDRNAGVKLDVIYPPAPVITGFVQAHAPAEDHALTGQRGQIDTGADITMTVARKR